MTKYGFPDYTQWMNIAHPVPPPPITGDLNELAVRLGAVSLFNRSGETMWWDDFEDNINKWDVSFDGTGAAGTLSTDRPFLKNRSLKLTTGNSTGNFALAHKSLHPPRSDAIGFEFAVAPLTISESLNIIIAFNKDGTGAQAHLKVDTPNTRLQLMSHDHVWTTIDPNFNPSDESILFHLFKLTFNTITRKYQTLYYNDKTYPISQHTLPSWPTTAQNILAVHFEVTTAVNANRSVYLDNVIVTQNEP